MQAFSAMVFFGKGGEGEVDVCLCACICVTPIYSVLIRAGEFSWGGSEIFVEATFEYDADSLAIDPL